MKVSEDKLVGWLVAMLWHYQQAGGAHLPTAVLDQLVERGWVENPDEPQWDGKCPCGITPAGYALYDLHAPDYGIDTIPEESEA